MKNQPHKLLGHLDPQKPVVKIAIFCIGELAPFDVTAQRLFGRFNDLCQPDNDGLEFRASCPKKILGEIVHFGLLTRLLFRIFSTSAPILFPEIFYLLD